MSVRHDSYFCTTPNTEPTSKKTQRRNTCLSPLSNLLQIVVREERGDILRLPTML